MANASDRIVVVGASAGGVRALPVLVAQLGPDFPAPVLVVLHVGSHRSILPELLERAGGLRAAHALDGESLEPGRIFVAPPDHHMLVADGVTRVVRGPKEHHARPAVDPLFRTAALAWGRRVIGVLLTGFLDDGTAGLQAIKRCGGIAVVQDPADAESPSMPASALRYVDVDHVVPLAAMGAVLRALVSEVAPAVEEGAIPELAHETAILLGKGDFMEHLQAIGKPSTFVCPDCDGALWEINDSQPPRFRCHTGHAYTLRSLQHAQSETTDGALWSGLRALQEKEILLTTMAERHGAELGADEASRLRDEAREIARHAETLRRLIDGMPAPLE